MTIHLEAAAAATHWQGRILRLIGHRENAVFEMETPQGRAVLRLHRAGYQNPAAIRSELWWCAALYDAGLPVPRPLPTATGARLVQSDSGRLASALGWVPGLPLGDTGARLTDPLPVVLDRHHMLGRLLAQVHAATDRLHLPADFTRPRWDADGLVGDAACWGRFWQHPAATPAQSARLSEVRDWLDQHLRPLADPDIGPIHADVLRENILVNGRSLSLIDFDDAGIGYRLYDLGTALIGALQEPDYPLIRDALIAGYGARCVVNIDTVEMFTLARCCASVGWTMPRLAADDPIHRSHIARALDCADQIIR